MEVRMVDGLLQVEGGRPLTGEITVRGAKNLVPKAMVAALLKDIPPPCSPKSSPLPMMAAPM